MKNIIKITMLCLIFILTGCSVEYNLTINDDYSISEKVVASEQTKRMESLTRLKSDSAISYLYNMYKRDNEKINLNKDIGSKNTTVVATTSHSSIEEYSEKFTSDIIKKINIEKDNDIVLLTANQSLSIDNNTDYSLIYDDIKINIYIPFKVIENNADQVSGNTYTWIIDKKSGLKNIRIKYNEGSKQNNVNIKINNKTYNISYAIITISGIIVLLLIIILVVYTKNKKNNSF